MVKGTKLRFFDIQPSSKNIEVNNSDAEEIEAWKPLKVASNELDISSVDDTSDEDVHSLAGKVDNWESMGTKVFRCIITSVILSIVVIWVGLGVYAYLFQGQIWILTSSPFTRLGFGPFIKKMAEYYYQPRPIRRKKQSG